jgi:RNA polymerase sigma factor (TIGR02999 family)
MPRASMAPAAAPRRRPPAGADIGPLSDALPDLRRRDRPRQHARSHADSKILTSPALAEIPGPEQVTELLVDWTGGSERAYAELLPLVHAEMRRLAAKYMASESPGHTLQPTALAHEAYLKLVDQRRVDWRNRARFVGVAAMIMRQILVNHARDRAVVKSGGGVERVSLSVTVDALGRSKLDLVSVHQALERLSVLDPRAGRIVELKFFGGLTTEEIGEVLKLPSATVERDWSFARAWLYDALQHP